MRYDAEHKERTRQRVVQEAAAAIREYGPDKIGVADLMAKAGLTHGGFYAHFKSKDDLVAEAITQMFDERYAMFTQHMHVAEPASGLAAFIDHYLTTRHRDHRQKGCPLPSLSGDLARMPAVARKRFEAGAQRLIKAIADVLRSLGRPEPDALAASLVAEMVGALALSRAVAKEDVSASILEAARRQVKARAGLADS
jgi:TetR/AcrR family transcriptional repressor of nem operon